MIDINGLDRQNPIMGELLTVLAITHLFTFETVSASSNALVVPGNIGCACPGDTLTFTCNAVGGGATIWRGTAFNCSEENNQIRLRHSQFASADGVVGSCNKGAIVGQSIGKENNCYSSRLNVSIDVLFNNKTVECVQDSFSSTNGTTEIGQSSFNVISVANIFPPPNTVNLSIIGERTVTFNWSPISSSCSSIVYVITSDCGTCPASTNTTSVTCSGLQLPTQSDGVVCSINVSSVVCGIMGSPSTPGVLAVPGVLRVTIVPCYTNESQVLMQLFMNITNAAMMNNDLSGSVTSYNVTYSKSTSFEAVVIQSRLWSCEGYTVCNYTLDAPSFVCSHSTDVNVSVSAINRIGQGSPSDAVTVGCTNEFVRVNFNSTTNIFSCDFLNQFDNTTKSCEIVFGFTDQEKMESFRGNSTTENTNRVSIDLSSIEDGTYFFVVTASSDLTTINIRGNFMKGVAGAQERMTNLAVILGVVLPLSIVFVLIIVLVVVFIVYKQRTPQDIRVTYHRPVAYDDSVKQQKMLKVITDRTFVRYHVDQNCALKEFMEKQQPESVHWKGHVFYELTDNKEDISEDKELIVLNKNTGKYYGLEGQFNSDHGSPSEGFKGEGITRAKFKLGDKYRVFVQSKGSGARHLAAGTSLLYEESQTQPLPVPLLPVPSDYFVLCKVLENGTTLREFREQYRLEHRKANICLEHDLAKNVKFDPIRDVFLYDKCGEIFTGPLPRQKLKSYVEEPDKRFLVFIVATYYDDSFKLTEDTWVLCEDSNHVDGIFHVLKVDEDNVRMSDFIKRKLGSFEKGRAFYEFTETEDLPCCRKVVSTVGHKIDHETDGKQVQLKAQIQNYYRIPETPGMGISPQRQNFIHCTSQGSRCLKKGTFLLYNSIKYLEADSTGAAMDNMMYEAQEKRSCEMPSII